MCLFPSVLHLIQCKLVIELEEELSDIVYTFCERGLPFTEKRLCKLAYELAMANKRPGFSPTKKMAGRYWLKGFLERFPKLRKKMLKICPFSGLNVPTQLSSAGSLMILSDGSGSGNWSINHSISGM